MVSDEVLSRSKPDSCFSQPPAHTLLMRSFRLSLNKASRKKKAESLRAMHRKLLLQSIVLRPWLTTSHLPSGLHLALCTLPLKLMRVRMEHRTKLMSKASVRVTLSRSSPLRWMAVPTKRLGVDSPFLSTIVLFKTQPFSLGFRRFSRKIRIPGKNGTQKFYRTPRPQPGRMPADINGQQQPGILHSSVLSLHGLVSPRPPHMWATWGLGMSQSRQTFLTAGGRPFSSARFLSASLSHRMLAAMFSARVCSGVRSLGRKGQLNEMQNSWA